jgi:hypothetical protein
MKIIRNKYIPFKGFKAINLFGILFVRKNAEIDELTINHEEIHTAQMKELWYVFFYLWYVVDWLVKLVIYRNFRDAYVNVVFEREAYANETDLEYLSNRKGYAFLDFFIH